MYPVNPLPAQGSLGLPALWIEQFVAIIAPERKPAIAFVPALSGANDSHFCLVVDFIRSEFVNANRKIFLMISFFILIICLCACSEMTKTEDNLPNYINFDQLIEGYGVENAVDDDCVVFVDSKLISGEDVWKTFIIKIEKKQSCCVRIVRYYSTDSNLCLIDLSYEDSSFNVNTSEGLSKEYKYLNHYEIDTKNSDSDYSIIDCYVLINQENVTYEEVEKSMISAILGDALDHYIVYSNVY